MKKYVFPTKSGYNIIIEAESQDKANEIYEKLLKEKRWIIKLIYYLCLIKSSGSDYKNIT